MLEVLRHTDWITAIRMTVIGVAAAVVYTRLTDAATGPIERRLSDFIASASRIVAHLLHGVDPRRAPGGQRGRGRRGHSDP